MPGLRPDVAPRRNVSDLWRRIRQLERDVKFLRSARNIVGRAALEAGRSLVLRSGGSLVVDGGTLVLLNRLGNVRFHLGALTVNDPDGQAQRGWLVYREGDGSPALAMFDADATDGYQQALNWIDRAGNFVFADDTNGGQGIARPYLPWTLTDDTSERGTSSGSFTTLVVAAAYRQHPKVSIALAANGDSGTAGEVRVVDQSTGSVIAGPTTVPSGGGIAPVYTVPLPAGDHLTWSYLQIQARVTSGGGSVRVRPYGVTGVQT